MNRQFPGRNFHPLASCTIVAHQYFMASKIFDIKKKISWHLQLDLTPLQKGKLSDQIVIITV
jgi:hypothetical protein